MAQIRHGTGNDAQQPHNELPLEDKRRDACLQSPLRCLLLCGGQNTSAFLEIKDTDLSLSSSFKGCSNKNGNSGITYARILPTDLHFTILIIHAPKGTNFSSPKNLSDNRS